MIMKPESLLTYALACAITLSSSAVFAQNSVAELLCNARKIGNTFGSTEARVSLKITKNNDILELKIRTPAHETWSRENAGKFKSAFEEIANAPKSISLDHDFFSKSDKFFQKISFNKSREGNISIIEIWNELNGSDTLVTGFEIDKISGHFVYKLSGAISSLPNFQIDGQCERGGPIF